MDEEGGRLPRWVVQVHQGSPYAIGQEKERCRATVKTEREIWIMNSLAFMKTVMRHRPEPMQSVSILITYTAIVESDDMFLCDPVCTLKCFLIFNVRSFCLQVKATIEAHAGDLEGAEVACAELMAPGGAPPRIPPPAPRGHVASWRSWSARSVFFNYVRDTLLTMSPARYKRVKVSIHKLLMEEDDDEEVLPTPRLPVHPLMNPGLPLPLRPSSAPSTYTPMSSMSMSSEQYQPHPDHWRRQPPQVHRGSLKLWTTWQHTTSSRTRHSPHNSFP